MDTLDRRQKRWLALHQDILNKSAALMTEKGSLAVTLDEIAKEADVARKTLYNHFKNKQAIIEELIIPVCQHAKDYLGEMEHKSEVTLHDLWDYLIELWENESLSASLFHVIHVSDYEDFEKSKSGFLYVFSSILRMIPRFSKCKEDEIQLISLLIYNGYMPIIHTFVDEENFKERFYKAMDGLILSTLDAC